jgi:hypothetical protein
MTKTYLKAASMTFILSVGCFMLAPKAQILYPFASIMALVFVGALIEANEHYRQFNNMSRQSDLKKLAYDIAVEIAYDTNVLDVDEVHQHITEENYDVNELHMLIKNNLVDMNFDAMQVHTGAYDAEIMHWLKY